MLRIGRTAKSDYAIGEDSYLSGAHFAVECDGAQCRVRDLGSSNGTFLNGDRITEKILAQGDSLAAGGCTFTVHLDKAAVAPAVTPPARVNTVPTATYTGPRTLFEHAERIGTPESSAEWPGFSRAQSALLNAIYKPDENVYAVVDASRDSRLPAFLDASGEAYARLDSEARVPAYIVAVPPQSRLLDVLIKDGWSRSWGFYCAARAGLDEIRAHWRGYVFLSTGDGRPVTFRFWDPRVLRALTPPMPPLEAVEFFGPVNRMIVESEKPEIALELSLSPEGTRQKTVILV